MRYGSVLFRDGKGGRFEIRINETIPHTPREGITRRFIMSTTIETSRVVFTASWEWWEIVSRDEEIVTEEDAWTGRWEDAAAIAGTNIDYDDSWVVQVTEVADRHPAIRPGDYACCDGYGSDVVFVRLV